jgi:hypothetical protein
MPALKYQPHGHLVLGREEDMPSIERAHEVQRAVGAQTALISKVRAIDSYDNHSNQTI